MKKISCILLISIMILSIFVGYSQSSANEPIKLRWGSVNPAGVPLEFAVQRFSSRLMEETDGRYQIESYPNAALGNERDLIEGTSMGTIDFCHVAGALTNFSNAFLTFDMPYLVKNTPEGLAKAYSILDGPIGQEVLATLEPINIKGLCFWESGFRHSLNSKREVRTPRDINGLKTRTMENEVHIAFYNAVGAVPTPMASSEAWIALQQGVIDAMDNNIFSIYSQKGYEYAKFLSLTSHIYSPAAILMSKTLYDSMSEEDRNAVELIAKEIREWERVENVKFDKNAIKLLEAEGVQVVDNIDFDEWQKACYGVYDQYKEKINTDHLNAFLNISDENQK